MSESVQQPAGDPQQSDVVLPPADTKKVRFWQGKVRIPWIDVLLPYWAIIIFALIVGFVAGCFGWGAEQWGPVAAWVGAVLTAAAVSVSLWQAFEAKAKADKDEIENQKKLQDEKDRREADLDAAEKRLIDELDAADKRHREQLEQANKHAEAQRTAAEERYRGQLQKSDDLLTQELAEQRRMRQVDALGLIWNAIAEIEVPTNNMTIQIERTRLIQAQYRAANTGTPEYDEIMENVKRAGFDFMLTMQQFAPAMMKAEISFTTAMMVVDEPNTLKKLEDTYQAFIDFRNALNDSVQDVQATKPVNVPAVNAAKSKLNKMRDPMIKTVREHLTQSRPLRKFNTGLTRTDPPTEK